MCQYPLKCLAAYHIFRHSYPPQMSLRAVVISSYQVNVIGTLILDASANKKELLQHSYPIIASEDYRHKKDELMWTQHR